MGKSQLVRRVQVFFETTNARGTEAAIEPASIADEIYKRNRIETGPPEAVATACDCPGFPPCSFDLLTPYLLPVPVRDHSDPAIVPAATE